MGKKFPVSVNDDRLLWVGCFLSLNRLSLFNKFYVKMLIDILDFENFLVLLTRVCFNNNNNNKL